MSELETIRTLTANVKHAVRNHETVSIGGGQFEAEDLKVLLEILEVAEVNYKIFSDLPDLKGT
jgi:hypothetical protein